MHRQQARRPRPAPGRHGRRRRYRHAAGAPPRLPLPQSVRPPIAASTSLISTSTRPPQHWPISGPSGTSSVAHTSSTSMRVSLPIEGRVAAKPSGGVVAAVLDVVLSRALPVPTPSGRFPACPSLWLRALVAEKAKSLAFSRPSANRSSPPRGGRKASAAPCRSPYIRVGRRRSCRRSLSARRACRRPSRAASSLSSRPPRPKRHGLDRRGSLSGFALSRSSFAFPCGKHSVFRPNCTFCRLRFRRRPWLRPSAARPPSARAPASPAHRGAGRSCGRRRSPPHPTAHAAPTCRA